ncbi:hypothetical protein BJF78_34295 [Pseudonocardia sp. CNS-139]|nr:hypothetical protein BJF78_34295 [Pseudonocardia sp. CNS-139]
MVVATLVPLFGGDATWRRTNAALADLVAERAAAGDRVLLADMADGGPRAGEEIPDGIHPDAAGYAAMAQVWAPAVASVLDRYGGAEGGPATCAWLPAAQRLAESIADVTDARAAAIRAELDRLGVTADGPPPPACEDEDENEPPARDRAAPANGVGRIALSADGNQHDPDDWASSAMGLAILAKRGLQANLVGYTYNDHIWDSDPEMRRNMTESVLARASVSGSTCRASTTRPTRTASRRGSRTSPPRSTPPPRTTSCGS